MVFVSKNLVFAALLLAPAFAAPLSRRATSVGDLESSTTGDHSALENQGRSFTDIIAPRARTRNAQRAQGSLPVDSVHDRAKAHYNQLRDRLIKKSNRVWRKVDKGLWKSSSEMTMEEEMIEKNYDDLKRAGERSRLYHEKAGLPLYPSDDDTEEDYDIMDNALIELLTAKLGMEKREQRKAGLLNQEAPTTDTPSPGTSSSSN